MSLQSTAGECEVTAASAIAHAHQLASQLDEPFGLEELASIRAWRVQHALLPRESVEVAAVASSGTENTDDSVRGRALTSHQAVVAVEDPALVAVRTEVSRRALELLRDGRTVSIPDDVGLALSAVYVPPTPEAASSEPSVFTLTAESRSMTAESVAAVVSLLDSRIEQMRRRLSETFDPSARNRLNASIVDAMKARALARDRALDMRARLALHASLCMGLQPARMLHAYSRATLLVVRQDLATARRQLLNCLAETAAVESDIVGRSGGRLGVFERGYSPPSTGATVGSPTGLGGPLSFRGRIVQDMSMEDVRRYAEQAQVLLNEVRAADGADQAVGAEGMRQSLLQIARAMKDASDQATLAAVNACKAAHLRHANEVRQVAPIVAQRSRDLAELQDRRERFEAELTRTKDTVSTIQARQGAELAELARSIADQEGIRIPDANLTSGEPTSALTRLVESLAQPLDVGPESRLARLARMEQRAADLARADAESLGKKRLDEERARVDHAIREIQARAEAEETAIRMGRWLRLGPSPSEAALVDLTARISAAHKDSETLQDQVKETDRRVASLMRRVRATQRLADVKADTRRLFAVRQTSARVIATFLSDSLRAAPFSEQLLVSLRDAHESMLLTANRNRGTLRTTRSPSTSPDGGSQLRSRSAPRGAGGPPVRVTGTVESQGRQSAERLLQRMQLLLAENGSKDSAAHRSLSPSRAAIREIDPPVLSSSSSRIRGPLQQLLSSSSGGSGFPSDASPYSESSAGRPRSSPRSASPVRDLMMDDDRDVQAALKDLLQRRDSSEAAVTEAAVDAIISRVKRSLYKSSEPTSQVPTLGAAPLPVGTRGRPAALPFEWAQGGAHTGDFSTVGARS